MPLTAIEAPARRTAATPLVESAPPAGQYDFDLHGLVGIRLADASAQNLRAVVRQIGLQPTILQRPADITIRFVDELAPSSNLRLIGTDAAFSDDRFFILRGKHKSSARTEFPMADIGEPCEIVCERGAVAVPHLIAVINLTMLSRGVLPMHASAFRINETGVLATGWAKGGKTEVLLGFAARGGEYVGDEWVYVGENGRRMFGIPEPIRVWDAHLREIPRYRRALSRGQRLRLRALAGLSGAAKVASKLGGSETFWHRHGRRVVELVDRQRNVQIPPSRLFNRELDDLSARFDLTLLVLSTESSEITVQPITGEDVAQRMVSSLAEERRDLLSYYRKFQFGFPGQRNRWLESAPDIERDLAARSFAGKPAYLVEHPYPVPIERVCDAIVAAIDGFPSPRGLRKGASTK